MESAKFNIRKKHLKQHYESLRSLLESGKDLGLDMSEVLLKLDSVVDAIDDDTIRIVLLGSISDGKTTTIAGLLGRLEKNMKIDTDESSDELIFYHIEQENSEIEVVDTPGLFGEKRKEVLGTNIRYSQITERYISEAHIVIYVTQAISPIKDSHMPILSRVLRDFNKLSSTIFVLNRMDDICDMEDEDSYQQTASIKRQFLINRLKKSISLTQKEEDNLIVVCVAANPYSNGLEDWFNKPNEYLNVSRIGQLRTVVENVIASSDNDRLQNQKHNAVILDMTNNIRKELLEAENITRVILEKKEDLLKIHRCNILSLKKEIDNNKQLMKKELINMRENVIADIYTTTSIQSFVRMVDMKLGMEDKKDGKPGEKEITCNVLITSINSICNKYSEANSASCHSLSVQMNQDFGHLDEYVKTLFKQGIGKLGNVCITNKMLIETRDFLHSNYKFESHQAQRWAKNLTKSLKGFAIVAQLALEAWEIYQNLKDAKMLDDSKNKIKGTIESLFDELFSKIDSDDYYTQFVPSYIEMKKCFDAEEIAVSQEKERLKKIHQYEEKLSCWKASAETVDYQEL